MATVGRWFATWIQDACSFDMSRIGFVADSIAGHLIAKPFD
jgi:hypothetical protein